MLVGMSSKMSGINFDTAATQRLWERHLVELNRYICCPKDYPKYCQEWVTFVEKRTTNILSIGGDVMNYDYQTEFEEKWKTTIPEIMKEIWKKKEKCLSHLLKSKHKYHSLEEIMLKVEHRVKHNIRDSSSSSSSSSSPHHSRESKKDKSEKKPKHRFSWFSSSSSSSSSSDTSSDHSRSPERRRRKRRRSGNSKRCSSICVKRRSHTSSCSCRRDHKPRRRRKSSSSEDSFRSRSRSLSHKRPKSKSFSRSRSRTGSRTRSRPKSSLNRKKYHSRSRSKSSNNHGKKFSSTDVSRFGFSSRKSSSSNSLSRKRSKSRSKSRTFSKRSRSRSISKDSVSKRSRTGSRRPRSRTGSRRPRSESASKSDRSRSRSISLSLIPKSRTAVKSRSRSDSRSRTTPKVSRSRSVSGNNPNIKTNKIESRTDFQDRDEGDINTQELIKPCANDDPNKGSDSNSGNKSEMEDTEESPSGENLSLDKLSLEKSCNTGTFHLSLDEIVKTVGSPKTNDPGKSTIPLTSREISDDDIKHCLLDTIYLLTSYRDKLGSFYIIFDDILSKLQEIVLSEEDKDISTLLTLDFILAMRLFQDKLRVIGFSNRIKDEKSLDIVHKIEEMIKFIFPAEESLPVTLYGLSMNDTAITIRNKSEKDAKLFIKFLLNYDGLIGVTSKEVDEVYVTSLKHLEKEFT
ncbi:UNVERIFIED_CONTAM: hypothetical protein RMT77_014036 [Armadillidium vulgare]